jgi:hypothetical protein
VLALILEPEDYTEEIEEYKKAARACAQTFSQRFGIVTDPKLVKVLKKELSQWFDSYWSIGASTIVIKRFDG